MDGTMLKSFLILFASVAVVIGVLFVLKRISKRFTQGGENSVNLKVLSKLSLAPKNHIYVVEADGQKLLLGVTEKSINMLSELTPPAQKQSSFSHINKQSSKPNINTDKKSQNNDLSFFSFLKSSVGAKAKQQ